MEASGQGAFVKGRVKYFIKQGVKEQDLKKRRFSCMDG